MGHKALAERHNKIVNIYQKGKPTFAVKNGGKETYRFLMADGHCQVLEGVPREDESRVALVDPSTAKTYARMGKVMGVRRRNGARQPQDKDGGGATKSLTRGETRLNSS